MEELKETFRSQHQMIWTLFVYSLVISILAAATIVYLWGRSASCASLGSHALAKIFLYVNPKLDADNDGDPCENFK